MADYQITEDDYVRANTYAQKKLRRTLILVSLLVPLGALAVLGTDPVVLIAVGLVYVFLLLFFGLIAPAINAWHYRRVYRKNPLLQKTQSYQISANGLRLWSENGESRYAFSELKKIHIYPEMVLVYPTTTIYHMLPRSVLTEEEFTFLEKHA